MANLRNLDLGVVEDLRIRAMRRTYSVESVGTSGSYPQNLEAEPIGGTLKGYLDNPTQAEREQIRSLMDGEVALLDLNSEYGIYRWVKVLENNYNLRQFEAGIWNYQMRFAFIPCVGFMRALTDDMGFSDLNYMRMVRSLNPHTAYCSVVAGLLTHQHDYYLTQLNAGDDKTLEFEIFAGDDLSKVELWGWKGAAWDVMGAWHSGGTAFGSTAAWTDDDSNVHTVRVDHDVRGAIVSNFTEKVSLALGNDRRAMIQIDNMDGYDAAPISTDYGLYQLKLRVKLTHSSREAARPYTIVTWRDGGFGLGIA